MAQPAVLDAESIKALRLVLFVLIYFGAVCSFAADLFRTITTIVPATTVPTTAVPTTPCRGRRPRSQSLSALDVKAAAAASAETPPPLPQRPSRAASTPPRPDQNMIWRTWWEREREQKAKQARLGQQEVLRVALQRKPIIKDGEVAMKDGKVQYFHYLDVAKAAMVRHEFQNMTMLEALVRKHKRETAKEYKHKTGRVYKTPGKLCNEIFPLSSEGEAEAEENAMTLEYPEQYCIEPPRNESYGPRCEQPDKNEPDGPNGPDGPDAVRAMELSQYILFQKETRALCWAAEAVIEDEKPQKKQQPKQQIQKQQEQLSTVLTDSQEDESKTSGRDEIQPEEGTTTSPEEKIARTAPNTTMHEQQELLEEQQLVQNKQKTEPRPKTIDTATANEPRTTNTELLQHTSPATALCEEQQLASTKVTLASPTGLQHKDKEETVGPVRPTTELCSTGAVRHLMLGPVGDRQNELTVPLPVLLPVPPPSPLPPSPMLLDSPEDDDEKLRSRELMESLLNDVVDKIRTLKLDADNSYSNYGNQTRPPTSLAPYKHSLVWTWAQLSSASVTTTQVGVGDPMITDSTTTTTTTTCSSGPMIIDSITTTTTTTTSSDPIIADSITIATTTTTTCTSDLLATDSTATTATTIFSSSDSANMDIELSSNTPPPPPLPVYDYMLIDHCGDDDDEHGDAYGSGFSVDPMDDIQIDIELDMQMMSLDVDEDNGEDVHYAMANSDDATFSSTRSPFASSSSSPSNTSFDSLSSCDSVVSDLSDSFAKLRLDRKPTKAELRATVKAHKDWAKLAGARLCVRCLRTAARAAEFVTAETKRSQLYMKLNKMLHKTLRKKLHKKLQNAPMQDTPQRTMQKTLQKTQQKTLQKMAATAAVATTALSHVRCMNIIKARKH